MPADGGRTETGHETNNDAAEDGNDEHQQADGIVGRRGLPDRETVKEEEIGRQVDEPEQNFGGSRAREANQERQPAHYQYPVAVLDRLPGDTGGPDGGLKRGGNRQTIRRGGHAANFATPGPQGQAGCAGCPSVNAEPFSTL